MKKKERTKEEISRFCLSMAQLIHSGVGPADGLAFLAEDEEDPAWRAVLEQMFGLADSGMSLSEVLRSSGRFSDYAVGLVAVGEQTGRMEEALDALAGFYEGRARLERRIRSAVVYPVLLSVILLGVVGILLMWVLPIFNEAYLQLGSRLTGLAGGLLAMGNGLRRSLPIWGLLLAALLGGGIYLAAVPQAGAALYRRYAAKQGEGSLMRRLSCARLAQALAMCMQAGLSARESLELAQGLTTGDQSFHSACRACMALLDEGHSLPHALRDSRLLSGADSHLLEAGIRSGSGEAMMEKIAARLLEESENAIERKAAAVEPALVILLSLLVGGILFSVMLPLMQIMSAIG